MHVLRNRSISRRTVLRGSMGAASVAVGLPILEAMLDSHGEALAGGDPLPRRLITWMGGNGFLLDRLEPTKVGADWQITEQLAPLGDVKDYINVCTGFANLGVVGGFPIGHIEGITAYSGWPYVFDPNFAYLPGGPTIDQVVADGLSGTTPVHSLQLGMAKQVFATCPVYGGISFRGQPGALTPLPPQYNPQAVWDSLFGIFPGPDALEDDRVLRAAILDAVQQQTNRLKTKLGTVDQQRLDAHLQGVSELSLKISALPPVCVMPEQPEHTNMEPSGQEQLALTTTVMADLLTYALECDLTRVASLMFLGPAGETPLTEAGVNSSHHINSHDAQYNPTSLEMLNDGIVFIMTQLAQVANRLRGSVDVTGTNLLDSTIIYASSDLSVGWLHSVNRHPVMLIGTGGGHLKYPGIHVQAIENDPDDPNGMTSPDMPTAGNVSDILLAVLQAFDPEADGIGGDTAASQDPLTEILA
jgi:hypothetical protein